MLGFIARADNTGLGMESVAFARHLAPEKVAVFLNPVYRNFVERFPGAMPIHAGRPVPREEIDAFLDGLDTLFCIERPYDWNILARARERGVKVVLRINYEWLPDPIPVEPDVMLAPVDWLQPPGTIILPFPVDRDRIRFTTRTRARTFVHIAGHVGRHGRNGSAELLEAIPLVHADVRFILYSQVELPAIDDPRVEVRLADVEEQADLFVSGDVLIVPRRYGGQALAVNEALAAGMPVLMTDMPPQSSVLPKECLIPVSGFAPVRLSREVPMAALDTHAIAGLINRWAHQSIATLSAWADEYADTLSWEKWLPRYIEICRG